MEKQKLQEFATRVTQANRSELVVVIYEASMASIEEGKRYLNAGQKEEARKEIYRAKGMVEELMRSLDLQYEIAHYLRQLYIYAHRELCQGIALSDVDRLDHAYNVLKGLLPSFQKLAARDGSQPVMANTQQIYAGLTYGKGTLNETVSAVEQNRGYEV